MKKPIPFDFLLDYLPRNIVTKPAIGMFYIYWEAKICLIFRQLARNSQHNGIWIATKKEHHASLKSDMPAITDFVFEEGELVQSSWLQLKDDHDDFEMTAIRICELVSKRDPRIGNKTPKAAEITRSY